MNPTEEMESQPVIEQNEVLELTRNSKGYTWKIKLRCVAGEKIEDAKLIERMEKLNLEMMSKFGGSE